MTAPTYINGQGGSVQVGSFSLVVESWTLNVSTEALDVTNTGSAGWEQNIAGISSAEGSVKAYFDTANVPTAGTPNITPGRSVTLTLNVGSYGGAFVVPARITTIGSENAAKGVVTFTMGFKGNGQATYPS